MSGGLATLVLPSSPVTIPARVPSRTGAGQAVSEEASYEEGSAIYAPTPLVKIAKYQIDLSEPGTPKALAGSEIESILAEKGTTGENVICSFPKLQSSDDFSRLLAHPCVSGEYMGAGPSSPLFSKSISVSGLDDMAGGFPVRIRSYLDLSGFDNEAPLDQSLENEDLVGTVPPSRSLNPLKNILDVTTPKKKILPVNVACSQCFSENRYQRKPMGAELKLDSISPPMEVCDF